MKHLSIRVWQEVACVRCACGISHLVMFDGAPTLTEVIEGDLEGKERVERLSKGQRWRKERTIREKREFLSCLIDSRFTGERRGKRGKARREKQRAGTEGRSISALGRRRYADGRRKKTGRRQLKTRASDRIKQYSRGQDGGRSSCYTVTILKSVTEGGTKADGQEELLKT